MATLLTTFPLDVLASVVPIWGGGGGEESGREGSKGRGGRDGERERVGEGERVRGNGEGRERG